MSNGLLDKGDFPLLRRFVNGHPVVYLDNAATALKPQVVIDAITDFYSNHGANIYRGIYTLAEESTTLYEDARAVVADFIGAHSDEIIFTKGATESINAIACAWACDNLNPGDQIVVTAMEHHANFIPWQQCAIRVGAKLVIIPVSSDGRLILDNLDALLGSNTKIVAVCQISNLLGTHNDIAKIIGAAHAVGAKVLVDAAQSVPHQKIDVCNLDCDFLVFSGHKIMGPTGVGVLYAKKDILESMRPYQQGGGMVSDVHLYDSVWAGIPQRFEAGTPPIASAIGMAEAIKYIQKQINFDILRAHEASLCRRFIEGLLALKRAKIYGPLDQLKESGHIVSFNIRGFHPHDVAAYCDRFGICVRAGLHCAHPLNEQLGIGPSVRMSTFVYNTDQDIDKLLNSLDQMIREMEVCLCVSDFFI